VSDFKQENLDVSRGTIAKAIAWFVCFTVAMFVAVWISDVVGPTPAERRANDAAYAAAQVAEASADKESQMGKRAAAAGTLIAAGEIACRDWGTSGLVLSDCEQVGTQGQMVLPQDKATQALVKKAAKVRDEFVAWCPGPRTEHDCQALLDRAVTLALRHSHSNGTSE
jgi:hypothetical protein